MRLINIILQNLSKRPLRSTLTTSGIALAVASFIALVGLSRGLEYAWMKNLMDRDTHILAYSAGSVELLTGSMDEGLSDALLQIDGVRDVAGELIDLISLDYGLAILISGWQPDCYLWQSLQIKEGHLPTLQEKQGAVIGRQLAKSINIRPKDKITIRDQSFVVTGIFEQGSAMSDGMLILFLPAFQELLGRPGKVTAFNLRLEHPENFKNLERVVKNLFNRFPEIQFTETRQITKNNKVLKILRAMAWSTSAIALLMGLFMVLNTLMMSVNERTREIGILSAIGWSSSRILTMIVIEGLFMATGGILLGSGLGIGLLKWLAGLPQVQGFIEPQISLSLILEVSAAAIFLGIAGSIYPAWRAVKLNPIDALHYE